MLHEIHDSSFVVTYLCHWVADAFRQFDSARALTYELTLASVDLLQDMTLGGSQYDLLSEPTEFDHIHVSLKHARYFEVSLDHRIFDLLLLDAPITVIFGFIYYVASHPCDNLLFLTHEVLHACDASLAHYVFVFVLRDFWEVEKVYCAHIQLRNDKGVNSCLRG